MYTKDYIEDYFFQIILNSELCPKVNLSWGYYFSHNDLESLETAKEILISKGYDFAEIIQEEKEFFLHIEKIEIHTIDSLYKRCTELKTLTLELQIKSFDGFDVESTDFR